MTDERMIAYLTFWWGAEADRVYAKYLTGKKLAEEEASRPALYGALVDTSDSQCDE